VCPHLGRGPALQRENRNEAEFTSENAKVVSEEAFVDHGVCR